MGGLVWFEGRCPISLSVTQNNHWLVAEGNLEKKYGVRIKKYHTPLKLENEIKKNYCCLKVRKLTKMFNLILCFSEFLKCLFVSA